MGSVCRGWVSSQEPSLPPPASRGPSAAAGTPVHISRALAPWWTSIAEPVGAGDPELPRLNEKAGERRVVDHVVDGGGPGNAARSAGAGRPASGPRLSR